MSIHKWHYCEEQKFSIPINEAASNKSVLPATHNHADVEALSHKIKTLPW